jgi:glycosyltransferase involved in cell wall biosynthesis
MTGIPVVSTQHAGIPDVVVDGETGYLVDEGDADGMSGRMLQLVRDPELAGRMGRAARKRAKAHYTLGDLCTMNYFSPVRFWSRFFRDTHSISGR